jgi:hypothetical protein
MFCSSAIAKEPFDIFDAMLRTDDKQDKNVVRSVKRGVVSTGIC